MPIRKDHAEWTEAEVAHVTRRSGEGASASLLASECNQKFHGGRPVRTTASVALKRTKLKVKVTRAPAGITVGGEDKEQEVKQTRHADGSLDILAVGRRIRTVEDAIAYVEADMGAFEVAKVESTAWDVTLVDPATKKARTVQNHRVFVALRPKSGPSTEERIAAILDGAFATRKARPVAKVKPRDGLLQVVGIFDPHIAKHAWNKETGHGDYDTGIGVSTLREANADLITKGDSKKPSARWILLGGDFFHHDGQGATTKGTPLDYDSRVQKMIDEGSRALFDIIEWSASGCPTHVVLVPGNHDSVLSWALQRILLSHFRSTKGVTVDGTFTARKYLRWGKCLLGLTHGDKGWKRLPGLMSREAAFEWGQTTLRHIHHGHLHAKRQVDTVDGVTLFQHPALCPPDGWHASEGFVSDRAQESYYYHTLGALVGMDAYSPDIAQPVRRGVAA